MQPRASRTELAGLHGGLLRVRLAAPPVDGAANDTLIRFLADRLQVPRSAMVIDAGARGRRKTVTVADVTLAQATERLGL